MTYLFLDSPGWELALLELYPSDFVTTTIFRGPCHPQPFSFSFRGGSWFPRSDLLIFTNLVWLLVGSLHLSMGIFQNGSHDQKRNFGAKTKISDGGLWLDGPWLLARFLSDTAALGKQRRPDPRGDTVWTFLGLDINRHYGSVIFSFSPRTQFWAPEPFLAF